MIKPTSPGPDVETLMLTSPGPDVETLMLTSPGPYVHAYVTVVWLCVPM